MAETPPVRTQLGGDGVLRVVLDRPAKRNALSLGSFELLHDAFAVRALDPAVRCVSLAGEGDVFCAGLDRSLLAELGTAGAAQTSAGGVRLQTAIDAIEACTKPTLASVHGACLGGGAALLLACDLRIASEDAVVALMEMRYAFLPDLGHIHRLQREVALARVKELLFFGEPVDAVRLAAWGVLNEVVPRAGLAEATARWEARCVAAPPLAVSEAKRLLLADPTGADGEASQRAALEANAARLLPSADFREGLAAALERRPPRFTGE